MAKINKNSTSKKKSTIDRFAEPEQKWYQAAREMDSWREYPVGEGFIERLRARMLEWVDHEDSEYDEDFLDALNIPKSTFADWRKKFPQLEETYRRVMNKLGRRKDLAVRKKGDNAAQTAATLGNFWDVWRKEQVIKSMLAELGEPYRQRKLRMLAKGRKRRKGVHRGAR